MRTSMQRWGAGSGGQENGGQNESECVSHLQERAEIREHH
jgi:hypothetical protein